MAAQVSSFPQYSSYIMLRRATMFVANAPLQQEQGDRTANLWSRRISSTSELVAKGAIGRCVASKKIWAPLAYSWSCIHSKKAFTLRFTTLTCPATPSHVQASQVFEWDAINMMKGAWLSVLVAAQISSNVARVNDRFQRVFTLQLDPLLQRNISRGIMQYS